MERLRLAERKVTREDQEEAQFWKGVIAVDYFITGEDGVERNLVEIVKDIEIALITNKSGEALRPEDAADYEGLSPELVYLPSRHLLDQPEDFLGESKRTTLLICGGCGESGCWPLNAGIQLTNSQVKWSNFKQPYRARWKYGLEFKFDRSQYEAALTKIGPEDSN